MNTCPSCKKEEYRSMGDYPETVANEFRLFIDFSHILDRENGAAYRCNNCGAYFKSDSCDVINSPQQTLLPNQTFVPTKYWGDVVALPPELFRIIVNECILGNRVCGVTSYGFAADGKMIYLDGSFRDGYIVSSLVKHHQRYQNGLNRSIYVCESMGVGISSDREAAEQL